MDRLEKKVDAALDALTKLVLIQERQKQDLRRFEVIERRLDQQGEKLAQVDATLQQWINRGIGAWALAATVAAGLKYLPFATVPPPEPPRASAPAAIAAPSTH